MPSSWTDNFPDVFYDFFGAPGGVVTSGDDSFAVDFPEDFFNDESDVTPGVTPLVERDRWTLFVRLTDRTLGARIATYTKAQLTPRWGQVGGWQVDGIDLTSDAATALRRPQAGIVVLRNNTIVFSGPVRQLNRIAGQDGRRTMTALGPCDLGLVADRLAMPEPANPAPPYGTNGFDRRAGTASSVMLAYVAVNAGPLALPQRQQTGLAIGADPVAGPQVIGQGRYQQLDVLLTQLGTSGGAEIGFRALQSINAQIGFWVSPGRDLSKMVVFEEHTESEGGTGTIVTWEIDETAGENYVVGGGSGATVNRGIREGANGQSIIDWGRIEMFGDHGDAQTTAEIDAAVAADLAQHATQFSVQLGLTEAAQFDWQDRWDLGDIVTVTVDGTTYTDRIREVQIVLEKDTATITPYVETNGGRSVRLGNQLISAVRKLQTDTTSTIA